jgi:glyoxylase-like metal-dependent hydrolase (beta-lactamase superfamily II)
VTGGPPAWEMTMVPEIAVLTPFPGILAFYDGRRERPRFSAKPNWLDDGAMDLGIASYAIVDGEHALVYDTHVSLEHGQAIRRHLEDAGVRRITVVLSHWHLDHVAGNGAFADCAIIANARTLAHLVEHRAAIEGGTLEGPPPICPLVLPRRPFEGSLTLTVGRRAVELIATDIHSDDATVLWLPDSRILLAGDTVEDTVTYVAEPEHLDTHLTGLDRLWSLNPYRILPNHGDPDWIASGGYQKTLIRATQQYIRVLNRMRLEPDLREAPLRDLISGPLDMEWITYYPPYEVVHRSNVAKMVDMAGRT